MPYPTYYSSLWPFRQLFAGGLPLLTWHKIGPRPSGARLKGMYLNIRRFKTQLAELREAGFESVSLDAVFTPVKRKRIGLTFDDGYKNVFTHALEPLAQSHFRAIQFLVADRLGQSNAWDEPLGEAPEPLMDVTQVREWLAAGHEIGSHTRTHPWLTRVSAAVAREEIAASKKALEDTFGVPIRHFCYPYGDWNPTVRDWVAEAGYLTACTTEFGVNTAETSPWALRRITARYPSRNLKAWLARWRRRTEFFAL